MIRFAAIALLLAACVEADDVLRKPGQGDPTNPGTSITNTQTGTTPTDPSTADCALVPATPVTAYELPIQTEEDFAFDGADRVIYQAGGALVASSADGGTFIVSPSAPADPSGLAMLSPDELIVAAPDTGTLEWVDVITAGSVTLVSGLDQPNGVTTGSDGLIYVSERVAGRVKWVDPDTGKTGVIADNLQRPNGLALNLDEDILYVATEDGIYALDRIEDWKRTTAPQMAHRHAEETFVGTVAVDVCGFVYTIDYVSGEVLRIDPDTGDSVLLIDLDAGASFGFGALHFGNGGEWPRGHLFTSNRRVMTGIDVGIAGVQSPAAR